MRDQPKEAKADLDYKTLPESASMEEIIDAYNSLADSITTFNKKISLQANFDGFIAEDVQISAGSTVELSHFLGVKPKWRIVLKQVGNGVITDVLEGWTDKIVTIKNNGAESVTLSLFVVRE